MAAKQGCFHSENDSAHLDKVATEFNLCFGEFDVMEIIAEFVFNPFVSIDIEQFAAKFH